MDCPEIVPEPVSVWVARKGKVLVFEEISSVASARTVIFELLLKEALSPRLRVPAAIFVVPV